MAEGRAFTMQARAFVLIAVLALAIGLLWLARKDQHPAVFAPPTRTAAPAVTAAPPSATASPNPSPAASVERHSTVILPWESAPPPSPTAPEEEPTVRPGPSPTPETPECVAVSYSAGVVPGRLGGVFVDIQAKNLCGRDLGPLEVWFWVGGYRQGDLIQSVRGHPFDPIPRDGEGKAAIVLPGSIDWYDRIDVRVVAPGAP
jgi:hypothetical protein